MCDIPVTDFSTAMAEILAEVDVDNIGRLGEEGDRRRQQELRDIYEALKRGDYEALNSGELALD